MGELTFFLGLHEKHSKEGIFISQDKYVAEILKKFDFSSVKTASTPIETQKPLVKDEVTPKLTHLHAVKMIFRYLKGQPKLSLWYPRDSPFDLESYSDSDYARENLDRKSTTGGCQFLGRRLISCQCKKQTIVATSATVAEYVATAHCCGQEKTEENAEFHQIVDFVSTCSINYALTEIGLGDRPKRQETILGGADAQTRFETASKRSSDPPLSTSHTFRSGEDKMKQETDLTDFLPPTPYDSPLSRGHTPRSDEDLVIKRLQKKVKRLEKKQRTRTPGMKLFKIGTSKKKTLDKENVSKQGRDESNRIEELNLSDKGSGETNVFDYTTAAKKDVNVTELVSTAGDAVNAASVIPDVSVVGPSTSTAKDIFKDEMTTMDDTLMPVRRTRPRTTLVVIHDVEEEPRRATPPPTVQSQDKGKGKMERIDTDALLTERLQQEEREQFIIDEQARMLVDLIAQRKSEQQAEGRKKRSRVDHDKESVKKQKLEEDDAK
nr:hypothetical protein [Tanacetum cinerariifolium]